VQADLAASLSQKKIDKLVETRCTADLFENNQFPCPVCDGSIASPLLAGVVSEHSAQGPSLTTHLPGKYLEVQPGEEPEIKKHPGRSINKTSFVLDTAIDPEDVEFHSPLHGATDPARFCDEGQDGYGLSVCDDDGGTKKLPYQQFVAATAITAAQPTNNWMCSDPEALAEIDVPVGEEITIDGSWWHSQPSGASLGPVDKGGGDKVVLKCSPGPPSPCPTP
jgi:hypothetical protein